MVFIFLAYFKWNASRICVSSLHGGHANLLCIVPILVYVLPKRALKMFLNLKKSKTHGCFILMYDKIHYK